MIGCFYFVVDGYYLNAALLQAHHIAVSTGKDVHIFVEGPSRHEGARPNSDLIKLHFNLLGGHLPKGLPVTEKWPMIVYLRVFAPMYLRNYDRAVYLDADVALVGDADGLWTLPMQGSPVAAVHDTGMIGDTAPGLAIAKFEWLKSIGLRKFRYFNSGVLVINIQEWLKHDFSVELEKYYISYGAHARMWDQDFLNFFFQDSWIELSPKWNFQITLFNFGFEPFFNPVLVHFTDGVKPWHLGVYDLDSKYPDLYKRMSASSGISLDALPPSRARKQAKWKWFIRRLLVRLGYVSRKQQLTIKKWREKRFSYVNFFTQSVAEHRFADIADSEFRCNVVEPIFNGRTVVVVT